MAFPKERAMTRRSRKFLFLAVKIAVAAALLAWLFTKVHLRDHVELSPGGQQVLRPGLISICSGIDFLLLACAAAGSVLAILIVSVRWWMLLAIQDVRISLWEATRLTFLGQFFNTVVPGIVGGDLVKAYYVSKHTPKKEAVLLSVFVDRVMGLAELSLMAAIMVVIVLSSGLEDQSRIRLASISTVVVLAVAAMMLALLLSQRLRKCLRLEKLYGRLSIAKHILALGEAAVLYRRRMGALVKAILITLAAHVVWVGSIALLGSSLGLQTPWYNYFLYVPLIYIIGAVPLSPGGVGVIENFYLIFFTSGLVHENEVFALAVLARLIPMFWGLPGAVVAVTGPRVPKAEAIEAELGLAAGNPAGPAEDTSPVS